MGPCGGKSIVPCSIGAMGSAMPRLTTPAGWSPLGMCRWALALGSMNPPNANPSVQCKAALATGESPAPRHMVWTQPPTTAFLPSLPWPYLVRSCLLPWRGGCLAWGVL